jgi:PKD repeat protein
MTYDLIANKERNNKQVQGFLIIALLLLIGFAGLTIRVSAFPSDGLPYNVTNVTGEFITPEWTLAQENAFCTALGKGTSGGTSRLWYHGDNWGSPYDSQNYIYGGNYAQPPENRSVSYSGTTLSVLAYTVCNDNPVRHYAYFMTTAPPPEFNFTANITTGTAPLTTHFTVYNSSGTLTYTFGDGSVQSGLPATGVSHQYSLAGNYTVTVADSTHTLTKTDYIIVSNPEYWLSISPALAATGSWLSGEVHSSVAGLANIKQEQYWYEAVVDGHHTPFYETGSSTLALDYFKNGTNWIGYNAATNNYDNSKGATMPNPVTLVPIGTGSFRGHATLLLANNTNVELISGFLINNGNDTTNNQMTLYTQDAFTGAQIAPSTISVRVGMGNWSNVTTVYGREKFAIPVGANFIMVGEAYGYQSSGVLGRVGELNGTKPINMWSTLQVGDKNLIVSVRSNPDDTGGYSKPIMGAFVTVTNLTNQSEKFYQSTNEQGLSYFSLAATGQYMIHATGIQYSVSEKIIEMGGMNPYQVDMYLTLIVPDLTVTPIQTTIPSQTNIPITPINGAPNTTVWACKDNADVTDKTWLGGIKNGIACSGFATYDSQTLVLAAIIIFFFMFVGSRYGKGIGAALGGMIGFVLSLAAGFIPFWVFAALLVLTGLAMAVYAISKSG